jgi:hypothetical protein
MALSASEAADAVKPAGDEATIDILQEIERNTEATLKVPQHLKKRRDASIQART